jgi:kynureninase
MRTPIQGWFGHADAFAFRSDYAPLAGVGRFAAGTPPILSCLALDGALDAFEGVDLSAAQAKARAMGGLWLERAAALGIETATPRDPTHRGAHVTLLHADGYAIVQALIARGVIGDFRAPDAMRFGFSPLYLRYADAWRAFDAFQDVVEQGAFRDPRFAARSKVT